MKAIWIAVCLAACAAANALSREGASPAGAYRCWSYNVSGGGGSCRLSPPLVLREDGTYRLSSERGTYRVRGDRLFLSKAKLWGPGRLDDQGHIVFEYTYRGWRHTVTYLREGTGAAEAGGKSPAGRARLITVALKVRFPGKDGRVGWINSAELTPRGPGAGHACQAIAYKAGRNMIAATFHDVEPGHVYTLSLGTGFGSSPVGAVDLRKAVKAVALTLDAAAASPQENVPSRKRHQDGAPPARSDGGYQPPRSDNGYQAPQVGDGYKPPR